MVISKKLAHLNSVLDFLQAIANRVWLMYDLEDRISHGRFVEQKIDRHVGDIRSVASILAATTQA